jgi:hypothetical protein
MGGQGYRQAFSPHLLLGQLLLSQGFTVGCLELLVPGLEILYFFFQGFYIGHQPLPPGLKLGNIGGQVARYLVMQRLQVLA